METVLHSFRRLAFLLVLIGTLSCASSAPESTTPWHEKESITIVVTDSGLGGISVAAEIERRLRESRHFSQVDIVFFNALFSQTGGYNALTSRQEKIQIFNRALTSMAAMYKPDQILVACNTLSVLIEDTEFAASTAIPVRSIVDPGVVLIEDALSSSSDAQVILFATRTTVEEDSHRKEVAADGYPTDRILTQKCPELANSIEMGVDSEDTQLLIETFVFEAADALGPSPWPLYASLNCSHYGYSEAVWTAAFEEFEIGPVTILNPNRKMVDELLDFELTGRFDRTDIAVTVVSMVEIPEGRRESIGRAVEPISARTAEALKQYEQRPELF